MQNEIILKRLLTGGGLRALLLGVNIVVSFFMMPFLIHALGDRLYGFWTLIGALVGFYGFLDLGLSSAVSRFVSRELGRKNHQEINGVINTALALFTLIGVISMGVTVGIALSCSLFVSDPTQVGLFKAVILVLGANIALSFPMRVFVGVLTAKVRHDMISCVDLLKLCVRTFFIFYFISQGAGLLALAVITFMVDMLGYCLGIYFVYKEFPEIHLTVKSVSRVRVSTLFHYSKFTFISQLADFLRFRIDSFVVAAFLDLSFVTIYSIASRLTEYFGQLISSIFGNLTPVYSQYEGQGDYDSIRTIFTLATRLCVTVTVFVGACIIFYGKYFIVVWVGVEYNTSYKLLIILCCAFMLGLVQYPSITLLYGISKHKVYAEINVIEGVLNLIFSLILVQYYGVYGVALGTLFEMFICKIFIQPLYVCRVINLNLFNYYTQIILLPLAKVCPLLVGFFYFASIYIEYEYYSIFFFSFVNVIFFLPILWFIVLREEERKFLTSVIMGNLNQ